MANEFQNPGGPKTSIRLATASDALPLAKLRFAFRSGLGQVCEGEGEFVGRCEAWMRERLREGGRWRCWIAEQGQALVGNVWVQLIEKIPNPVAEEEYHAYVTNFYVPMRACTKLLLDAGAVAVKCAVLGETNHV